MTTYGPGTKAVNVAAYGAVGDGVTDDSAAIQAAIAAAEAANPNAAEVWFSGDSVFAIASQITANSVKNTKLIGVGGKPTIKYTGTAMNTGTQDNSTGAMVLFSGTDHEFGGIENITLDANSRANFCLYMAGYIGSGFRVRGIHLKSAQLDCIKCDPSGSTGPICAVFEKLSAFPAISINSGTGICGRYVVNFNMNMSSGIAILRECNFDNGVSGFVAIQGTSSFAGNQVLIENVRMETNQAAQDGIVLNFAVAPAMVIIRQCKHVAAAGAMTNYIHNISAGNFRPVILIDPYTILDAPTNIYKDDNDSTKNLAHSAGLHETSIWLNAAGKSWATFGAFPVAQPNGTGETVGFTTGAGTAVKDDSTFTGNVGATAYRISDIVKALKNTGIMAK